MKLHYKGKTKNVYALDNGNYLLKFKDDVTGTDGVFDPGANQVGLSIAGSGKTCVKVSAFFFEKIAEAGIPTHYVSSNADKAEMTVRPAILFGKGIEMICRLKATGSFVRRYGDYCIEGQDLDYYTEATLKDDMRGDPFISLGAVTALGIMTKEEFMTLKALTKKITAIVAAELKAAGADLYDIKLEFGRVGGEITLVDEVSGGNMRAYNDGKVIAPLDFPKLLKV